jgi:P27 family predicted phage terminase small subunit
MTQRAPGGGRKPKPTALKAIQGNAGKRAKPKNEPTPEALTETPEPPEWMGDIAAGIWRRAAPWLAANKIMAATDLHNLEAFCMAYQRWREAQDHIDDHGLVVTGAQGGPMKNPACTVANESLRQVATFGALLGLDPSSRARLKPGGQAEKANVFELLRGGKTG